MSFPKEVRERALVAAARHCCACRRYKGVKVEVHHIVPTSEGGDDEFHNAIVLCFDCHADAGHYNPRHPRGTKYSADELRRARDAWYRQVETGTVQEAGGEDVLHVRYLICKDLSAMTELVAGDLSRLPLSGPRLIRNDALGFLADLVSQENTSRSGPPVPVERFSSEAEYVRSHPDAVHSTGVRGGYAYFDAVRTPSIAEFTDRVAPNHPVTRLLIGIGEPSERIGRATAYWEYCGEDHLAEVYHLRHFWGVFLCATNISSGLLTLMSMSAVDVPATRGVRGVRRQMGDPKEITLPPAPLAPGDTAVVPLGVVLSPLGATSSNYGWTESTELGLGQIQDLTHVQGDPETVLQHDFIGPSYHPDSLRIRVAGGLLYQPVHELDLTNTYVLTRYYEMGSCPHLFARCREGLTYVGELFARTPGALQVEVVRAAPDWTTVYIAELEEEVTELASVQLNGALLVTRTVLRQGDVLEVTVEGSDDLCLVGRYMGNAAHLAPPDPWRRNQLVEDFLARDEVHAMPRNGV